jgi:hypothetical protein
MTFRCKQRGLHVRLTTLVVSACAMVALFAFMAQSASAFVPCPARVISAGGINTWEVLWGTRRETAKGVTLCRGYTGSAATAGYLQIVDATDGAKIRLQTTVDASGAPGEPAQTDTLFEKKTASEWYSFIRGLRRETRGAEQYLWGAPTERLFSTTNATFFKDSENIRNTRLPLPFIGYAEKSTLGVAYRIGHERSGEREPDWNAPKKVFVTRWPESTPHQDAQVSPFPTFFLEPWEEEEEESYWEAMQPWERTEPSEGTFEAAVGFSPEYRVGERSRRNYIGTYGYITYIFTSYVEYTNAQMRSIMQEIQPGMEVVQMDGGGSAQFYSAYGELTSSVPFIARRVPNVLAIYRAP